VIVVRRDYSHDIFTIDLFDFLGFAQRLRNRAMISKRDVSVRLGQTGRQAPFPATFPYCNLHLPPLAEHKQHKHH